MPDNKSETRVFSPEIIELRVERDASGKPRKISGYAAVFNKFTDLGWFKERILPGAFEDTLKSSDVRCLVNHDPNLILGRNTNGTLKLEERTKGLWFENELPDTQAAHDYGESIARGDISGCSFAFQVKEEVWTRADDKGEPDSRDIIRVDPLYDVGPVTYPAYPDTTVAARSKEEWEKRSQKQKEEKQTTQPVEQKAEEKKEDDPPKPEYILPEKQRELKLRLMKLNHYLKQHNLYKEKER